MSRTHTKKSVIRSSENNSSKGGLSVLQQINEMEIVVRSTEIDVNGHVNNAKYLEYLEWGREDWYEQFGLDYDTLKRMDVVTVVAHISADYRAEAIQNDRLRIKTWLDSVRNTSLTMKQTITNHKGILVLEASVVIVTVSATTHAKIRVPDVLRQLQS
ncbi:acyl-CoA thioesterase [Alicyclobacillus curvatus]|nr:acyl-CoA thioesterase [Alicyclobacillus curvatus]